MAETSAASRLDPAHVPLHKNERRITGRGEACEEGERVAQTIEWIPSLRSYWAQSRLGKGGKYLPAPASQKPLASPGRDCSPDSRPSSNCSCRFRHGAGSPLAFPLCQSAAARRALVSSVCAPCTCRPYNSPFHPSAKPSPTAASIAAPPPAGTPMPPFFPKR